MDTDLKSDNVVEVNIALVAAAHLVPNDMIPVIFPIVLQRTNHPKVKKINLPRWKTLVKSYLPAGIHSQEGLDMPGTDDGQSS